LAAELRRLHKKAALVMVRQQAMALAVLERQILAAVLAVVGLVLAGFVAQEQQAAAVLSSLDTLYHKMP
jgi:uncharacterized membrane protein